MKKKPLTGKQILAWIGILVLLILYLVTFIASLIGTTFASQLFQACLYSTIIVPVLCWFFIMTIGWVKGKGDDSDQIQ